MKPSNIEELQRSFTVQAAGFDSGSYHLSKKEYLDYLVLRSEPKELVSNEKLTERKAVRELNVLRRQKSKQARDRII